MNRPSISEYNFSSDQVTNGQECFFCTDPDSGADIFCPLRLLQSLGIDIQINDSTYKFTAPNGITIDTQRFSNAADIFNQQLPTGSLTGYISEIFGNIGSKLSQNTKQTLGIILGTIFIIIFLFFTIICVLLMAYGLINISVGIVLILIALFICTLALIISFNEAYNLSTNLEKDLFNGINPVLNTLDCALLSGICCYTGLSCGCPNVSCVQCKNAPFVG